MKMYISKKQVIKQTNVITDELIVHGQLIVAGTIKAKKIKGHGSVQAQNITAQTILVKNLTADNLSAEQVEAERIDAEYADVKDHVYARICLLVRHLKAHIAASPMLGCDEVDADACIVLPTHQYSWPGFKIYVWFRRIFLKTGGSSPREVRKYSEQSVSRTESPLAGYDEKLEKVMRRLEEQKEIIDRIQARSGQESAAEDKQSDAVILRSAA